MIRVKCIGLGDMVEAVLAFFGFRQWEGCQCEERKAKLNRIVLYIPVLVTNDEHKEA